jgi:hypothetical protein
MNPKKMFLFITIGVVGTLVMPRLTTAVIDNADSLYIAAGETYVIGGDHSYNKLVRIEATGALYVTSYDGSANTGYIELNAPLILIFGTLNADYRGFRGQGNYQEGPGVGSYPGGGASAHGGGSKPPYGTTTGRDIEMGSGGGDTGGGLYGGGNGGGLIILRGTSVEVTPSGIIEADGMSGLSSTFSAGAGSGGGIYMQANEVLVRGRLSVHGGAGGRIKIFHCTLEDASSTIVLNGGAGGTGTFAGQAGGNGTYHTQVDLVPSIASITDVENDQGRHVRITWGSSCSDNGSAIEPVTHYTIWRRIDALPMTAATPFLARKVVRLALRRTHPVHGTSCRTCPPGVKLRIRP